MPNTHAPKITKNKWRTDIGRPENGAIIVRIPTRIRMLGRDMSIVYQTMRTLLNSRNKAARHLRCHLTGWLLFSLRFNNHHKLATHSVGVGGKMRQQLFRPA